MTSKSVVDEVEQLLQKRGFQVNRQVRFEWLTNRAPTEVDVPLPPQLKYRLVALHTRLGGDWSALTAKRRQYLRIDFQVDATTLVEIDEKQHFSSARLTSMGFYDGMDHGLDLDQYNQLCSQYRDSADRYLHGREAVDFPFPGGRTAQRAYFDTTKDLLAAAHGYRLIRLPVPGGELTAAAQLVLGVLM